MMTMFLIGLGAIAALIGIVEWVAKKVRNQDNDDDWGGHCQC
nr:MAG TPA: hypothetical protein [Caudoviricetes sp.]